MITEISKKFNRVELGNDHMFLYSAGAEVEQVALDRKIDWDLWGTYSTELAGDTWGIVEVSDPKSETPYVSYVVYARLEERQDALIVEYVEATLAANFWYEQVFTPGTAKNDYLYRRGNWYDSKAIKAKNQLNKRSRAIAEQAYGQARIGLPFILTFS